MSRTRKVSKQSARRRTAKYADRDALMERRISCAGTPRRACQRSSAQSQRASLRLEQRSGAWRSADGCTHRVACDGLHEHLRACAVAGEFAVRLTHVEAPARGVHATPSASLGGAQAAHAPTLHRLCMALPKSFMPGPDKLSSMPCARRREPQRARSGDEGDMTTRFFAFVLRTTQPRVRRVKAPPGRR